MNGLVKLVVVLVVVFWGFQACTGPDKRTLESFTEASQQNDWSPERGSAAAPSETEEALAEHLSAWVSSYESNLAFDDSYSEGGTGHIGRLASAAEEYPLPDSAVPQALRQAEKHLTTAQAALDKRQYAKGKKELEKATRAITPVSEGVPADWAAVEKQTGVRLTSNGTFYSGASDTRAEVEGWVDGDTVITSEGKVRLIGIDSPEMSDQCSLATDAKEYAEFLAPQGSDITLVDPHSVNDVDKYGRMLRYVDLEDGTDVGYSLLLSNLAKARYDSRDGYQWHPREGAYRETGAEPDRKALCGWEAAAALALATEVGDDDDDDERSRYQLREDFLAAVATAAALPKIAASAKEYHSEQDRWEDEEHDSGDSGGGGGSFDVPGWLCPTRWC